jgi:hypothetical protein
MWQHKYVDLAIFYDASCFAMQRILRARNSALRIAQAAS